MARQALPETTNNFAATGAPTVNDDVSLGYDIGSRWVDVSNDKAYVCLDNSDGAAVWTEVTAGAAGGIANVVEDVTPQLGGDLDMNTHNIQTVTPTEMAYVSGVTSAIQTQLNGKAASAHTHAEADITDLGSYLVTTSNLSDVANAATARGNLGVAIGTDVQAYDAELAALAGLTSAANKLPYFTGSGTADVTDLSAFARTILDDADADAVKTTLGLVIGTNVQAYDAELAALAGLTSAADKLPYFTGSGSAAVTDLTAAVRTFLALADPTSSTTQEGLVEASTSTEVNTGTDAARSVTPDSLAGSYAGTKSVTIQVIADATDTAVADDNARIVIPSSVGGMNLVTAHAYVATAGTTGTTDIQIYNLTQTADMLTTKITIDSTETSSRTAATAPVIDTANDDVAAGDVLRVDIDAVSTTAAKGLYVELEFRLP